MKVTPEEREFLLNARKECNGPRQIVSFSATDADTRRELAVLRKAYEAAQAELKVLRLEVAKARGA